MLSFSFHRHRLLSAPGVPKLRELVRSGKISKKLRLKGKGHEFSDVARLLNYYQQWLDNLYPRAKFADGLQLVEKVGHSKRMQVMRREWIDEGKPGYITKTSLANKDDFETDDLYGSGEVNTAESRDKQTSHSIPNTSTGLDAADDSLFIADSNTNHNSNDDRDLPEDDELDALMAEQETRPAPSKAQATFDNVDSEGEDDLDALLAEQETQRVATSTSTSRQAAGVQQLGTTSHTPNPFNDDDDEDELDALIADQEAESLTRPQPSTTQVQSSPSKPLPVSQRPSRIFEDDDDNGEMDDLDALLAEQDSLQASRSTSAQSAGATRTGEGVNEESEGTEAIMAISQAVQTTATTPGDEVAADPPSSHASDGVNVAAKAKGESQDADGEDFDAEGMFSSSPARQDD